MGVIHLSDNRDRYVRLSNYELLRIVSILLIVLHHFAVHIGWPDSEILVSEIAIDIIGIGGKVGVVAFVLITGYFQSQKSFKVRSVIAIWLEAFMYGIAILLVTSLLDSSLISRQLALRSFFPVVAGLNWFIPPYIFLYCLSPCINLCLNRMSHRQLDGALSCAFVLLSLGPFLLHENPLESHLVWMCYLYCLGAYIQKYGARADGINSHSLNPARLVCAHRGKVAFFSLTVVLASIVAADFANCVYRADYDAFYFVSETSPFTLAVGIVLFLVFSDMTSLRSKTINALAKSSLAVYLISDNPIIRKKWDSLAWVYYLPPVKIVVTALVCTGLIYASCALIEMLRLRIASYALNVLERRFGRLFDKIDESYSRMLHLQ